MRQNLKKALENSNVLICAATSLEVKACENAIRKVSKPGKFSVLKTGMGPKKAAAALARHLAEIQKSKGSLPERIFIAGFSGAVDSHLECGDSVFITKVFQMDADAIESIEFVADLEPVRSADHPTQDFKQAVLLTSPVVIKTQEFKKPANLNEHALCVDMESAELVRVAQANKIPVSALRYITDSVSDPLPEFIHEFFSGPMLGGIVAMVKQKGLLDELFLLQKKSKIWTREFEAAVLKVLEAMVE